MKEDAEKATQQKHEKPEADVKLAVTQEEPTTPVMCEVRKNQAKHFDLLLKTLKKEQPLTHFNDGSEGIESFKIYNLEVPGHKFKMAGTKLKIGDVENHPGTHIVFEEPRIEWFRYFNDGKHHNALRDEGGKPILKDVVSRSMPWSEDENRNKKLRDIFVLKGWKKSEIKLMLQVIEAEYQHNTDISANYMGPHMGETQYTEASDEDNGAGLSDYACVLKIMENEKFISNNGNELYIYQNGVYRLDENSDQTDGAYTELVLDDYGLQGSKCVLSKIARLSRTQPEDINPDPYIINFPNGLYDLRTNELSDHTPDYKSTIRIPHMYLDDASGSEVINEIIEGILQPEDIITFKEITGYYLSLLSDMKKNVFVVGEKDTGKTTLIDIVRNTVGNKQNCSMESLELLSKDRFSKYNLKDKLLNADDDVNDKTIFNTDVIKQLSGGSVLIRGEKKNHQAVLFKNTAKLMFGGNDLPPVFKEETAYIERWIIFECHNVHRVTDKNAKRKGEILDTITPLDYDLFVRECLDAFRGVLERGYFTISKSNQDIKHKYQILSNPLGVFIDECTEPTGREEKAIFWKAYNKWAIKNGAAEIPNNKMGEKMGTGKRGLGYEQNKVVVDNGSGVRIKFWEEISLTDEARKEFVFEDKTRVEFNKELTELEITIGDYPGESEKDSEDLKIPEIIINPYDVKVGPTTEGM